MNKIRYKLSKEQRILLERYISYFIYELNYKKYILHSDLNWTPALEYNPGNIYVDTVYRILKNDEYDKGERWLLNYYVRPVLKANINNKG